MKNDSDTLVAIATFPNDWQAHIAKGLLDEEGIPSIIDNEVFNSIYPLGMSAMSSLRLMVNAADADRAATILAGADFDTKE